MEFKVGTWKTEGGYVAHVQSNWTNSRGEPILGGFIEGFSKGGTSDATWRADTGLLTSMPIGHMSVLFEPKMFNLIAVAVQDPPPLVISDDQPAETVNDQLPPVFWIKPRPISTDHRHFDARLVTDIRLGASGQTVAIFNPIVKQWIMVGPTLRDYLWSADRIRWYPFN